MTPTKESRTVRIFATTFLDATPGHGEAETARLTASLEAAGFTIDYRCDRNPRAALRRDELAGAVAVIADLERYDSALLERIGPRGGGTLRIIARYGTGVDSVDLQAATRAGIIVANTPGANARATAEWTLATMLAVAGRRVQRHEAAAANRPKSGPSRIDLSGATVGLVGTGAVARALTQILAGFGTRLIATAPRPDHEWARTAGVRYVAPEQLYAEADFVTLNASAREQLVGAAQLALMGPRTVLVNCARALLVDARAVWRAVHEGRLFGYGVDDRWTELDLPLAGLNIVTSPHVGSDSDSGKAGMRVGSLAAVHAFLTGGRPASVVNPEVFEE